MNRTLAAVYIALSSSAFCQMTPDQPPLDLGNLYERVSGSEFVVTARAASVKGVSERQTASEEELEAKLRADGTLLLGGGDFGYLFTATVTGTVCRRTDFRSGSSEPAPLAGPVYLFVPNSEPLSTPSLFNPYRRNQKEFLLPGSEYLLFLRRDPKQEEIVSRYELDSKLTYYRGFELSRDTVRMPAPGDRGKPNDRATPLLSAVTAFCEAVKPGSVGGKIAGLAALKYSNPELQEAADAAIRALQPAEDLPGQP